MQLAFCLFRYFPYGGLARDMLRIADHAHERGHRVRIYTAEWRGPRSPIHDIDIVSASGWSNHARAAGFARAFHAALPAAHFDRIVGFNKLPGLDVYYAADPCFAARARYTHRPAYRWTPRYRGYAALERSVFSPASRTRALVLSERAIGEYQEFYGTQDGRFTLLPPSIRPEYRDLAPDPDARRRIRMELGVEPGGTLLLMVGSAFKTKGVDRAVRALASLSPADRKTTRLVVAGQGEPSPFIRLAERCGVRDRVHFLGGRNDIPDLLRAADLLLHPAYNENTGTVLLEAMAAGLPVLTTAACGYAYHIRRARAGCVLDAPFDQHALNHQLNQMLQDDRRGYSENGRAYALQPLFYNMPEAAVDAIESPVCADRPRPGSGEMFFYLSDQLQLDPRPDALESVMSLPGQTIRRVRGHRTLRISAGGRGYFLKTHDGVGWREVFKNLLYLKVPVVGADNEWHALHALSRLGVQAPAPLGFGKAGRNPARRRSFVLMSEIRDAVSLEQLAAPGGVRDLRLKRKLTLALAQIARTLHRNGINHRDFYLCHFLLDESAGAPTLYLIDLHRAQIRRKTPERWIVKDLAGLYFSAMDAGLTRNDRLRFIRSYCGVPLRQALKTGPNWHHVQRRAKALYHAERAAA